MQRPIAAGEGRGAAGERGVRAGRARSGPIAPDSPLGGGGALLAHTRLQRSDDAAGRHSQGRQARPLKVFQQAAEGAQRLQHLRVQSVHVHVHA